MTLDWVASNIGQIASYLIEGDMVAIPTDTLYGVLALARDKKAVDMVYKIKGRNPTKPVIILIGKIENLEDFGIKLTAWQREQVSKYWPGAVSIVLPCDKEEFEYLHRGTKTLAFRLPDDELLGELLKNTGPLIAPSANPEGQEPGLTIENIHDYFGEKIDLYIDGGPRNSPPSTLISLINEKLEVLRGELIP